MNEIKQFEQNNEMLSQVCFSDENLTQVSSACFVTSSSITKQSLNKFTSDYEFACMQPLIFQGSRGSGHKLLAQIAWAKLKQQTRPFSVICSDQLTHQFDFNRAAALCEHGDLFIENAEALSRENILIFQGIALSRDMRLIYSFRNLTSGMAASSLLEEKGLDPIVLNQKPLSERKSDIPLLLRRFLMSRGAVLCSSAGLRRLMDFNWPGEVEQFFYVLNKALKKAQNRGADFISEGDIELFLLHDSSLRQIDQIMCMASSQSMQNAVASLGIKGFIRQIEASLCAMSFEKNSKSLALSSIDLKVPRSTLLSRREALSNQVLAAERWIAMQAL